jgi:hypothetical protein
MKTLYLLITLTQNGAGDVNSSFVNTQTLEQCQQKAVMVEAVFKGSNIAVIESRCIKSKLQFSEFGHALNSRDIQNYYLISFDEDAASIVVMTDWQTCMQQKNISTNISTQSRLYCSSSIQSVQ